MNIFNKIILVHTDKYQQPLFGSGDLKMDIFPLKTQRSIVIIIILSLYIIGEKKFRVKKCQRKIIG